MALADQAAIKVLIAERHKDVRRVLATIVEALGDAEVTAKTTSAAEALESGRKAAPDVAIIDLGLFRREIQPYPAAVELLEFAAENAGLEVSYRDFLKQSSSTDVQIRTELGAISKVARKLFGKKVWPVSTRQGSDGVMRYFMSEGIAEWWMRGGSARTGS